MKFNVDVCYDADIGRNWRWGVFPKDVTPDRRYRCLVHDNALEAGRAFTAASARRKGERAARRIAKGQGGGTQEYSTKGKDDPENFDLLEKIAKLEEELGI